MTRDTDSDDTSDDAQDAPTTTDPPTDHGDVDELAAQHGYGAVPDLLRDRSQWVAWRIEEREKSDGTTDPTKVPIKPFDSGHPYAKAADPNGDPSDTWGSFEQAVRYHAQPGTTTDGIGFVFAPDDVVLGVDFDDVHDPDTDETEPIAEEWLDRFDTYAEYSPSGTGYHVLAMAILPRDASNRAGLPRENDTLADVFEDEPHVEVYDQKRFFTVTGDHVDGTPTEVNQRNDALSDFADEYLIDDGGGDNASPDEYTEPGVEVTLDDEKLIGRAKKAANGDKFERLYRGDTSGYESQSEADMAFCQMLAFWTQKDRHQMDAIFRDSGLMRPKWDKDRGEQTYGEMTIAKACKRQRDVYDPSRTDHSPDTDQPVVAPDPDPDGHSDDTSDASGTTTATADTGDRPGDEAAAVVGAGGGGDGGDPPENSGNGGVDDDDDGGNGVPKPGAGAGFVERSGCYGQVKQDQNGDHYFDQWTNFEIEVNSFLMVSDRERKYDLTIHPASGHEQPFDITATPDDFSDIRRFKEGVACGFSTTFDGDRDALSRIKEFVAAQNAHRATGTHYMGRHGDEYVFPEGTLTADGWTDQPEHVYVPRGREEDGDSLGDMCTLTPEAGDQPDADKAGRVAELLPQLHDRERFLPVLGWFYAVPFRQHVYEWTGQFNFLSVTGETGSGKTRTTGLVNGAFGMDQTPLSANDTTAYSVMMTFASSNAVPVWYDEFKPSDMKESLVGDFSSALRSATTSNSPQRGNQHGGVTSATLKAPVAIGGEEQIQGSAEERRGIFTTYPKGVTDPTNDYRAVYEELKGTVTTEGCDLDQHALAYYQFALSLSDSAVRDLWTRAGEYVDAFCDEHGIELLEDLVEQGLVTIRFGLMLHNAFCEWLGTASNPLTNREIDDALLYVATDSTGGVNRQTHVDEYLSLMARAAMAGQLVRDEHYTFVNANTDAYATELRFHPSSTYDIVKRYASDHDATEDLLNSKDDYRERFRDQLSGDEQTYVTTVGQTTSPMMKRCDGVAVEAVEAEVNGFERSMFDAPELLDADNAQEETDPDAVTPVGALDKEQSYTDVEASIAGVSYPDSENIVLSATVRDGTGAVDLVQFNGAEFDVEEGARHRLRDVAVRTDKDGALQLLAIDGVTGIEVLDDEDGRDASGGDDGDDDDGGGGAAVTDAVNEALPEGDGDGEAMGDGGTAAADPDPDPDPDPDADGARADVVADAPDPDEFDGARAQVMRVVRDRAPCGEGVIVGASGLPPAEAREALGRLREDGRVVQRAGDDKYVPR